MVNVVQPEFSEVHPFLCANQGAQVFAYRLLNQIQFIIHSVWVAAPCHWVVWLGGWAARVQCLTITVVCLETRTQHGNRMNGEKCPLRCQSRWCAANLQLCRRYRWMTRNKPVGHRETSLFCTSHFCSPRTLIAKSQMEAFCDAAGDLVVVRVILF